MEAQKIFRIIDVFGSGHILWDDFIAMMKDAEQFDALHELTRVLVKYYKSVDTIQDMLENELPPFPNEPAAADFENGVEPMLESCLSNWRVPKSSWNGITYFWKERSDEERQTTSTPTREMLLLRIRALAIEFFSKEITAAKAKDKPSTPRSPKKTEIPALQHDDKTKADIAKQASKDFQSALPVQLRKMKTLLSFSSENLDEKIESVTGKQVQMQDDTPSSPNGLSWATKSAAALASIAEARESIDLAEELIPENDSASNVSDKQYLAGGAVAPDLMPKERRASQLFMTAGQRMVTSQQQEEEKGIFAGLAPRDKKQPAKENQPDNNRQQGKAVRGTLHKSSTMHRAKTGHLDQVPDAEKVNLRLGMKADPSKSTALDEIKNKMDKVATRRMSIQPEENTILSARPAMIRSNTRQVATGNTIMQSNNTEELNFGRRESTSKNKRGSTEMGDDVVATSAQMKAKSGIRKDLNILRANDKPTTKAKESKPLSLSVKNPGKKSRKKHS